MIHLARRTRATVATGILVAACVGGATSAAARSVAGDAPDSLPIGVLYPLTGTNASAGVDSLHGVELAVEIVNGDHPELDLPFAAGEGLPSLDGAMLEIVSADTQGTPETGASEVDRVVTSEGVVAVMGAFQSAVTLTASQRAERLQIPFVNGESSAVSLTEQGLQYFFRTGPTDRIFGETFFAFLAAQSEAGQPVERIGIIHTNDQYGSDGADVTKALAEEAGYEVVVDVAYDPKTTTDLASQVQQVRAADPDVLFVLSFTNDAILLVRTMNQLEYQPPALLAYGAGFSDPQFLEGVGDASDGYMSRAAWSADLAQSNPAAATVAEMFEEEYGQPMTENSARSFTATLALAQAIDDAGSTEADAIREALSALDIPGDQTIMPWEGIRFDDNHQNELAAGIVHQIQDGAYRVVFPADVATAEAIWPLPGS